MLVRLWPRRRPRPTLRDATEIRAKWPTLVEVAQELLQRRSDRVEGRRPPRHFQATRLVVSAILMTAGAVSSALGVIVPALGQPQALPGVIGGPVGIVAGLTMFLGVCSSSTYARIGRIGVVVEIVVRWVFTVLSVSLSVLSSGFLIYGLVAVSSFPSGYPVIMGGILSMSLSALTSSMVVLAASPSLLTIREKRNMARVLHASLASLYLAAFVVIAAGVALVVGARGFVVPATVVIALASWLLLRLDSRRTTFNAAIHEMREKLTAAYAAARTMQESPRPEGAHRDFTRSILDLQDSWVSDPAPSLSRVSQWSRADPQLREVLDYVATRVAELPRDAQRGSHEKFLENRLGGADESAMAVLVADFVSHLREQLDRR